MAPPPTYTRLHPLRRRWRRLRETWRIIPDIWRDGIWAAGLLAAGGLIYFAVWKMGRQGAFAPLTKEQQVTADVVLARDDFRVALNALERATRNAPSDPRVWREAVTFLSRIASPDAVGVVQSRTSAGAQDTALRVALVMEALRIGTSNEPGGPTDAAQRDSAFHRLSAAVALATGRTGEFEAQLEQAILADPGDASAHFNLAAFRLWSADPEVARRGERDLIELQREPALRVRIALERLQFAGATSDPMKALNEVTTLLPLFQAELAGAPPRPSESGEPPGWADLLAALEIVAATNTNDAALYSLWLGEARKAPRALLWLETLPPAMQATPEVAAAITDLAARQNDMPRLRRQLGGGTMGKVPAETIDLLVASRVQRLRFNEQRGRAAWEDAVEISQDSLDGLRILTRIAGLWGDREGEDRALVTVTERFPNEKWAYEALRVTYSARRQIDKLWNLYQAWAPRVPENKPVQQTWILLGAILNKSDLAQQTRAEALLALEGDQPETATLLAGVGARWRANRIEEATELFNRIPEDARKEPRVALWRVVLAAAADEPEDLAISLEALPRELLLNEEQQLVRAVVSAYERRKRDLERSAQARAEQEAAIAAAAAAAAAAAGVAPADATPGGDLPLLPADAQPQESAPPAFR